MEADSRGAVTARLQQMGYFPISIAQGASGGGKSAATAKKAAAKVSGKAAAVAKDPPSNGGGGMATTTLVPKMPSKIVPKPATNGSMPMIAKLGGGKSKDGLAKLPAKADKKGTSIKEAAKAMRKSEAKTSGAKPAFGQRGKKVKAAEMASFNRQLADLLSSGVALVKALTILQKQTENEVLHATIEQINSDVQGGDTFADALAKHPRLFSKLYIAMVRSGEAGGMLDDVLQRLADFSEQEEQLKGRVKSALAYPVVMMVAGSGAVFIMFTYIVPKIVSTFKEMGQSLPTITKWLIAISEFCEAYWPFVIGGGALAVIGFWQFMRTAEGRALFDRNVLRVPILGEVVQKREVSRFARTLGSLLKNGVPILTALQITRDVLDNSIAKAEVEKVSEQITQGASIAEPLRNSAIFPPVAVNMMSVGEETGRLEHVLLRISESYEMETDRKIRTLTSLIEPLIIVVMGCIVAFIVIAMLLPIFSLDPTGGGG